jgi:hypothetical protein
VPGGKKTLVELKTSCQIDLIFFSNLETPHPDFLRTLVVEETGDYSITFVHKRTGSMHGKNEPKDIFIHYTYPLMHIISFLSCA